jgi:hypothetical protein
LLTQIEGETFARAGILVALWPVNEVGLRLTA